MRTSIDVFAKAREHERLEQLRAARELDLVPYFRVLEGPTLPEVEMEGKRRIMLGSNNYLGRTGDPRVREAAQQALDRYGTAVGQAFQIADDLLDIEGDSATFGKATGKDAAAGKATIAAILGVTRAKERLKALVADAETALAPFGAAGKVLKQAAWFVANRSA